MSRSLVDRFLPWIPGFVPGRACEIYGERRDIKKIIYWVLWFSLVTVISACSISTPHSLLYAFLI